MAIAIAQIVLVLIPVKGQLQHRAPGFRLIAHKNIGEAAFRVFLAAQLLHAQHLGIEGHGPIQIAHAQHGMQDSHCLLRS